MLGRYSTLHLAGLGPNTALFNSVFQLFAFLGVTVANAVRTFVFVSADRDVFSVATIAIVDCKWREHAHVALAVSRVSY